MIGVVNWQTKITGPTVMNVEGIMYNCPRDMTFMILFPSIHVITSELPVMKREHRGGIYSVSAYYVAKSLAELPQYTILPILYSTLVYWMSGLTQLKKFAIFLSMNVLLSWTAISIGKSISVVVVVYSKNSRMKYNCVVEQLKYIITIFSILWSLCVW